MIGEIEAIDVLEVTHGSTSDLFYALSNSADPDRAAIDRQAPKARLLAVDHHGGPVARCSLWWNVESFAPAGIIGHYSTVEGSAAAALLTRACEVLRSAGCTRAVGPMDGSTWGRYRMLTERGTEPPFILEPDNPDDWPTHFAAAGFTPVARYVSAIDRDIARSLATSSSAPESALVVRRVDLERFEQELLAIHDVVLDAFAATPFFTPISRGEFVDQFRRLRPFLRSELVHIAERNGRPEGFVFGIPDLSNGDRSGKPDTVVIKTIAVRPQAQGRRLGELLTRACYAGAMELDYTRAIHALMRTGNASHHMAGAFAAVFRRYALFGKELQR